MTVGNPAARRYQALERGDKVLERVMTGRGGDTRGGARPDQPHLQFGHFLKRGLDHVLDSTDLGRHFECCCFHDLLAQDFSSHDARVSRVGQVPTETTTSKVSG